MGLIPHSNIGLLGLVDAAIKDRADLGAYSHGSAWITSFVIVVGGVRPWLIHVELQEKGSEQPQEVLKGPLQRRAKKRKPVVEPLEELIEHQGIGPWIL